MNILEWNIGMHNFALFLVEKASQSLNRLAKNLEERNLVAVARSWVTVGEEVHFGSEVVVCWLILGAQITQVIPGGIIRISVVGISGKKEEKSWTKTPFVEGEMHSFLLFVFVIKQDFVLTEVRAVVVHLVEQWHWAFCSANSCIERFVVWLGEMSIASGPVSIFTNDEALKGDGLGQFILHHSFYKFLIWNLRKEVSDQICLFQS